MSYSNNPKSLDSILMDFMKRIPQRAEMKRGLVLHFWPEVVGDQVNKITREVYFERDRLIVKVINDAWRHELHMNRYSIKKKLNLKVGSEVVKDVIVRC
jgi:predicted nucleic acid-binding Zn ribbon protein